MKNKRQFAILELIEDFDIDTQEELTRRLNDQGFDVTQSTVSRDIKDLKIIKIPSKNGNYKYISGTPPEEFLADHQRFVKILQGSVIRIRTAKNIVVIKTYPGMASAAGAAIDAFELDSIAGSIAGDDTIFLAVDSDEEAESVSAYLKQLL